MEKYHKIQTVFKRDPETNNKNLLIDQYSIPEFEYLANNQWDFTEKVDGINIRIIFHALGEIEFRGKTDDSQIPAMLFKRLQDIFFNQTQKEILRAIFTDGACLYGEGYGGKIQKGSKTYSEDYNFVLFDVKIGDWWLERHNIENIADRLGIDTVPIIGSGTLHDAVALTQLGFESQWGPFLAEGIVARPKTELFTRGGERIITKIKHKDFIPYQNGKRI